MGSYTTRTISSSDYKKLISIIRNGYQDDDGINHRPNRQIATILVLEANLGCRIGDILKLTAESFVCDGGIWKINITEQKTGKHRCFIVPAPVKKFIDKWMKSKDITTGKLFTVSAQAVWKVLRQATSYLSLDDISTHSMRKYCAENVYRESGSDIEVVCEFLQHSDTKTTRTYLRRSDAQLEKAITGAVSIV